MREALANGASVNAREPVQGKTTLIWAAQLNPNPDAIGVLVEAGASRGHRFPGVLLIAICVRFHVLIMAITRVRSTISRLEKCACRSR